MIYNIKNKIRNFSYRSKIINRVYEFLSKRKTKLLSGISDEQFAKIKYRENTGKVLNLKKPITFNEKIWWLKINNRDPLLTICSDKVTVRKYVENCGLKNILNDIYGVYDHINEINFKELPRKAVIKVNNGSGTNILWDRKKNISLSEMSNKFEQALQNNYYYNSREWNYKNIVPKILVEKYLVNKDETPFADYRFLCFDGIVKLVFVDIETMAQDGSHSPYARRNVYDREFNYLDIKVKREQFDKNLLKKPDNFEKMIEYAEKLSNPFVFCRVDMYNISGKIIFGEITFYPGGGNQIIEPERWEIKLGQWINLRSKKIRLLNNE